MSTQDVVVSALNAPLPRSAIKTRRQAGTQLDYVEGWWVIQKANEIFGFGGWQTTILDLSEQSRTTYQRNGKDMVRCTYTCLMSMSAMEVTHQDVGVGTGFAATEGDAIEGAAKEAVTDALKRCARHWGNQFGLALYDKDQEGVESNTPPKTPSVGHTSQTGSTGGDTGFHTFLKGCKEQKERIGDYLYQRTLKSFNIQKSALEAEHMGSEVQDKIIAQLSDLPDLYSEEGANIEVGRLIQENANVGKIVKGRNCKTDADRKLMIEEARSFVNHTKAA